MSASIRQQLELREREILATQASKSADSKGRVRSEDEDPIRPAFQRDRDRIIHTKAFRRLKHKTQVFVVPDSDHTVTRMTHTIEVQQVARSIARALNLNEDLAEAIAGRTELDFYLCGLQAMVDDVRQILKGMGFDRKQIRYEKYD